MSEKSKWKLIVTKMVRADEMEASEAYEINGDRIFVKKIEISPYDLEGNLSKNKNTLVVTGEHLGWKEVTFRISASKKVGELNYPESIREGLTQ
tara:strand:- start:378 stop:659 length:282 start_codon:yes stop_codon:yes gene_type:complete